MVALYTVTIFAGSALLFLVQPMFARMVLPLLGGSPSVWNTAMVFYQAALLAGYAYAHATTVRFAAKRQAAVHILLLLAPLAVLPVAIPAGWTPPTKVNPIGWLLALMAVAVGLPFFAVATMSPLLQKWFSATRHPRAADPYFLYSASNVGSILALLSYPLLIEPRWSLAEQATAWTAGYAVFLLLALGCASCLWLGQARGTDSAPHVATAVAPMPGAGTTLPIRRRLRWVALSFVPSSLMLGTTTYLTSDIAVVPLMWILPLALYLLTFVLAFARRQIVPRSLLARAWPILLVPLLVVFSVEAALPVWLLMLLHLGVFFVAALLCHSELAADRPPPARLTEFYFCLSAGGMLGGVFNALIAPFAFHSVTEYPLVLLAVVLLRKKSAGDSASPSARRGDWLWPALLALLAGGLVLAWDASPLRENGAAGYLAFGLPAIACYFFSRRNLRFALGGGAVLLAAGFYEGRKSEELYTERSFFGVHRVTRDRGYQNLIHGITLHGLQSLDPARRHEPLAYYHRTGPAGDVFEIHGRDAGKRIAIVGLGAGSLTGFARAGQTWTCYEIDPVVVEIARDPRYFTYLRDAPADVRVVLGDARLSLAAEAGARFDLIVLDAFSSDAIPVHLLTREALAIYRQRLAPGGLLAFHISNLHVDLEPPLAELAHEMQLAALIRDDTAISPEESALGKSPSVWLVMAENAADLSALARDPRWQRPRRAPGQPLWTDDYSSLLRNFRWR